MRKTIIAVLAAGLLLALCGLALAEIKYFTHIQADVPPGWTAFERDQSVILAADDKSAVITITVQSAQGDDAEKIAGIISKSVNGTMPVEDVDNNGYFFNFTAKQAGPGRGFVKVDQGRAIVVGIMGDNPQVMGIINSLSGQVENLF